jgi:hypothetical protein
MLVVFNMQDKKRYIVASLAMTISFFVVRTLPLPYVVYAGIWVEGIRKLKERTWLAVIQIIGVSALCSLNAYWRFVIWRLRTKMEIVIKFVWDGFRSSKRQLGSV